ncbi:MAG: hypothetical protein GKR87_00485 [Kiritimatiellae bacterium]|nr:hypothetical protein [Kiritimatiellia bacterium]
MEVEDSNQDGLPDQVNAVMGTIPNATDLVWNGGGTSNPPLRVLDGNNNNQIDVGETLVIIYNGTHTLFERFSGASHIHAETN